MSQVRVDFIGDYTDLKKKTERAEKSLERMRKKVQHQSRMMNQAFKKIGAGLGFFAITNALKRAGEAAANDARSQRLLALQLKTTTKASDKQIASNEKFIDTLSNQVGIVDDELRPAFAKLLRGTGKVGKSQKLLKIALDGSAASGKPLSNVADALTKAFNGNFTTLYKLAPQLKKTKGGIDEYAASVKGAAATAVDPFTKLTVVLDNLNEQVGTALLPAFQGLANFFIDNGPAISQFIKDLFDPKTALGQSFKKFGDTFADFAVQVDDLFKRFDPNKKSGVVGFFEVLKVAVDLVAIALEKVINLVDLLKGDNAYLKLVSTDAGVREQAARDLNLGGTQLQSFTGSVAEKTGMKQYVINVNKAIISAPDVIREIQRFERQTGKTYLVNR
jgi:hypothetical protein